MKGSNIFYGLLLLFVGYGLTVPTFQIDIGVPITIPNPFFDFGQIKLFLGLPLWVGVVFLGIICIVFAFDEKSTVVVERAEAA